LNFEIGRESFKFFQNRGEFLGGKVSTFGDPSPNVESFSHDLSILLSEGGRIWEPYKTGQNIAEFVFTFFAGFRV
jgi:hypothetical protein